MNWGLCLWDRGPEFVTMMQTAETAVARRILKLGPPHHSSTTQHRFYGLANWMSSM
jgi:hypothetical protein